MAAISPTTFWNTFPWMKMFSRSNRQKVSIVSGNGLAPHRRQAVTWTNAASNAASICAWLVPGHYVNQYLMYTLKNKNWHDFNQLAFIGVTGCCHCDDLLCRQWRQLRYHCHSRVLVTDIVTPLQHWTTNPHLLTHWGRVTHICVSKFTIIGSDNGLSPGRRQAIIWSNDEISLIGPLGTNFGEIVIEIYTFSFKKKHFQMSSGKWWPFCLGLNVLIKMTRTSAASDDKFVKMTTYPYLLV